MFKPFIIWLKSGRAVHSFLIKVAVAQHVTEWFDSSAYFIKVCLFVCHQEEIAGVSTPVNNVS